MWSSALMLALSPAGRLRRSRGIRRRRRRVFRFVSHAAMRESPRCFDVSSSSPSAGANCRICAATAIAISAGSLPPMPGMPIGQISRPIAAACQPLRCQPAHEARALGRRADQPDAGEIIARQRRGDDGEIDLVVVRHHQHQRAGGQRRDLARPDRRRRRVATLAGQLGGNASGRESIQVTRSGRSPEQSHQRAPDMPGAEQRDVQPRRTHRLEQHADMAAAALAERRTQRKIAHHGSIAAIAAYRAPRRRRRIPGCRRRSCRTARRA